ncbi:MAG: hypothetical protein M3371_09650 [Acidobacteriota bacterium]|nr:hypothetical protein [Acidobacteriota bacterium]
MTGSEDLGQSLRAELESYLDRRLNALQDEIVRLHSQLNEAFTRLAERVESERQADPSITHAISEHLRSAASHGDMAGSMTDVALIKAAIEDINEQGTQADVLNTLVNRASSFAPRIAFFVVKHERATGWRARGLEGTVGDEAIREISLPLSSETLLSRAVNSRSSWSGAPGANAGDHDLINNFSDEPPARIVSIPLVAREKAVAVLYADSGSLDAEAVNLEALETLVRVSGMAVELLASKRVSTPAAAAAAPAVQPSVPAEAAAAPQAEEVAEPAEAAVESQPEAAAVEAAPEAAPMPVPVMEAPAIAEETPAAVASTPATETPAAPESFPTEPSPARVRDSAPEARQPAFSPAVAGSPMPALASMSPAIDPLAPTQTVASGPLGTKRRWGQADTELPIEVSEDERRFHNDARRFARLLVSEIKLYNEQKVKDGRVESNLYERLREEIDRSRQMYDKRVAPNVSARYDYFHHELVSTLAEGDAGKLGGGYPGAGV